jgi:hypothetical protein
MASATEPLRALIDPIDGTRAAVEARRWVWPMVALALCASAAGINFAVHWNAEPVVVKELEKAGEMNTTTEQDLATKVQTTERIALVGGVAKGVLGMPLTIVLVAAALKWLGWLTGKPAPFGGCLSAAAIAFLPICLYYLVFAVIASRSPELARSQIDGLVPSNLAAWVHAGPKASRALAALDFFNLWSAVLLGLGFAAATGGSRLRGIGWGLIFYAAYAAVAIVALPGMVGAGA